MTQHASSFPPPHVFEELCPSFLTFFRLFLRDLEFVWARVALPPSSSSESESEVWFSDFRVLRMSSYVPVDMLRSELKWQLFFSDWAKASDWVFLYWRDASTKSDSLCRNNCFYLRWSNMTMLIAFSVSNFSFWASYKLLSILKSNSVVFRFSLSVSVI